MAVAWQTPNMGQIEYDQFAAVLTATLKAFADDINPILNIGITGSRRFPRIPQRTRFAGVLARIAERYPGIVAIHHGCCTGADELAHHIGRRIPGCQLFGYPGMDALGNSPYRMRERGGFTTLHEPALYAERNERIVRASTVVIACPLWPEDDPRSVRSGTWQTVRKARKLHKPVLAIMADGELYI